jgi:hypothetical protein
MLFNFMRLLIAGVLLTVLLPRALASTSNLPLGHEESFLANTGVSLLGSPSGVYYNPANLATVESSSLSASGTSYVVVHATSEGQSDLNLNAFLAVPHTLISTWVLEKGALSFSILVPDAGSYDIEGKISSPASANVGAGEAQVYQSISANRTLAGLSWGQKAIDCGADCHVDFGSSLFFSYAQSRTVTSTSLAAETPQSGFAISERGSASITSLLPMIGVSWQVRKDLSFGLRLEAPSILLKSESKGHSTALVAYDDAGTLKLLTRESESPLAAPALPQWGVATGLKVKMNENWTLLSDFYVGERMRSVSGNVGFKSSFDANVATKVRLSEKVEILGGSKFDLSQLVNTPSPTESRSLTWLSSAGLGWKSKGMETIAGIFYVKSILLNKAEVEPTTAFNESKIDFYGALLSGLYRF